MIKSAFAEPNKKQDETTNKLQPVKWASKVGVVKQAFLAWSQSVTYHCFPKIFRKKANMAARLVWALTFVSFAASTCYILLQIVVAYYQYNVVSTIVVVNERPTLFPVVTICDSNPFTSKEAQRLLEYLMATRLKQDVKTLPFLTAMRYLDGIVSYMKSYVNSPQYSVLNKTRLGFKLADLILVCRFNGIDCDFGNDFHWMFHYEFGNCYQFNSGLNMSNARVELKKTTYESKVYGLVLQFGPVVNYNEYPMSTFAKGLQVFVHNQSLVPSYSYTPISIESGKETNICIDRTFSSNVPSPYSACVDFSHENQQVM